MKGALQLWVETPTARRMLVGETLQELSDELEGRLQDAQTELRKLELKLLIGDMRVARGALARLSQIGRVLEDVEEV